MAHKYIKSLRVVDANGVDKPGTIGSKIALEAGYNTNINIINDEIELEAGRNLGKEDPTVRQKYIDISEGNPPFTGIPYWISTIQGATTKDGSFFFNVDKCYHMGQFDDAAGEPTGVPELAANMLSLLDTCPSCTDCPEFDELYSYITMVQEAIDGEKDLVQEPKGNLDQYAAMIERWNYVVHLKSWRYNAEATGYEIHASCKYTNHTTEAIPAGVIMSIDFTDAPFPSRAFIIDTAVQGTITRSDLTSSSESEEDPSHITLITLETTAPMEPGDGIRFYGGSLSPDYVGDALRVSVDFSLTTPSGGIGNQDNSFNTNKMVVIEPWPVVYP